MSTETFTITLEVSGEREVIYAEIENLLKEIREIANSKGLTIKED